MWREKEVAHLAPRSVEGARRFGGKIGVQS
jgi:hypothetical protein